MLDDILKTIAPHYCYGCDKIGSILCDNCKYDIFFDQPNQCLICLQLANDGVCRCCGRNTHLTRAWYVGERKEVLQKVIDDYKFMRLRAAYRVLASLLHETVAKLPRDTIVIPVPTISTHIRQRGYDHCLLIAKEFARLRGLTLHSTLIIRNHSHGQRGKSRQERKRLAADAFRLSGTLENDRPYIIIDDILTTSATISAVAHLLHDAGVEDIFAAVVARQILDE